MIPGFDFTSVIYQLGYPAGPIEVADVPGIYVDAQWRYFWKEQEDRKVFGIALMQESPKNTVEQTGNVENAVANLMMLNNVPMYAPGVLEFEHPPELDANGDELPKRDWQSFFKYGKRWYKVTDFDFMWSNTNCRSYNGVLYSEFGVSYTAEYQ